MKAIETRYRGYHFRSRTEALAWTGAELRSSAQERARRVQTLDDLAKIRGRATGWSSECGASHLVFEGAHFDERALKQLEQTMARNPHVTDVCMHDTVRTDGALAVLRRLKYLEEIQLERSDVTDDALADMGEIPSLRRLYANGKWTKRGSMRP